jgi:hypothetical protein
LVLHTADVVGGDGRARSCGNVDVIGHMKLL